MASRVIDDFPQMLTRAPFRALLFWILLVGYCHSVVPAPHPRGIGDLAFRRHAIYFLVHLFPQ
jgi:hypothetical protein